MLIIKEVAEKFVSWTKLKIKIHVSERRFYPREKQIWWVSLGQNIGTEVNGKNERFERPVLVLRRYHADSCLVLPLSSRLKTGSYYMNFQNQRGEISILNFSQVRSISTKRFIRMISKMDDVDFGLARTRMKELV